jgi:hypothetical protein
MSWEMIEIGEIRANPNNPRVIKNEKFAKLVRSIKRFPEMLELRPIVVNAEMIVLGGNMRLRACAEAGLKQVPIIRADKLTEEQQSEFIIKDNVAFGDWDWDVLANEWEIQDLEEWGVNVPTSKNTELLSGLKYEPLYYQPENLPEINLKHCVNLDKYEQKLKVIEESDLPEDRKQVMRWFAYRFIRIDFERVADYYAFNASEEEQKVMERLRLVLTDSGINGFIEDDLI